MKNDNRQITYADGELREMIARRAGPGRTPDRIRVVTDTSDFFNVDYDDVLIIDDRPYFIRNYEREGRFGLDDEPKFWVRRAVDLFTGELKILKMAFYERFTATVGGIAFDCIRSPMKETRILDLVRGHPHFMQGRTGLDPGGNMVRVIDYIHGPRLSEHILSLGGGHEDYFYNHFPAMLAEFIELVEAIRMLHLNGEKHGDIRRDHILRDNATGGCRWIDFDFNYYHKENAFGYDLFGLGNVLVSLTGRGDVTVQELRKTDPATFSRLREEDLNIVFSNRVVNLKKVYPYIPESLNLVMAHFSGGAHIFYDETGQLLADLREAGERLQ